MRVNAIKYYLGLLIFVVLLATQWDNNKYSLEINGQQEISYKGKSVNHLKISFIGSYDKNVEVILSAQGSAPTVNTFGGRHSYNCDSSLLCTLGYYYDAGDIQNSFVEIQANPGSDLFVIKDIIVLNEKSSSELFMETVKEFFVILILIYPFFLFLHYKNKHVLTDWLLLSISFYLLFKLQPVFLLFCVFYASLAYKYRFSNSTWKTPSYIFLGSIAFFIFFKYLYQSISFNVLTDSTALLFVPIGMSYFIFKLVDSQLNWNRDKNDTTSFREYLLFLFLPTTLPAGPIDNLKNFLNGRINKISKDDFAVGFSRVCWGVFQKIVISDYLIKNYINSHVSHPMQDMSGITLVLYLPLVFIYIYVDFSAYSNIAIGLSRLLGFKVPENFNWPVFAATPQEFWKRWHMSLSNWCLRNIYFPMLIKSKSRFLSICLVMLFIGLWHQISLSWLCWAVHHVIGLSISPIIARLNPFKNRYVNFAFSIPLRVFTFMFISAGYAFASINDFNTASQLYQSYWLSLYQLLTSFL